MDTFEQMKGVADKAITEAELRGKRIEFLEGLIDNAIEFQIGDLVGKWDNGQFIVFRDSLLPTPIIAKADSPLAALEAATI